METTTLTPAQKRKATNDAKKAAELAAKNAGSAGALLNPPVKDQTEQLAFNAASIKQTIEPTVGAESILNTIQPGPSVSPEDEEDKQYNQIEDKQRSINEIPENYILEKIELPVIRKVAVKKIDRFNFKLGMERSKEHYKLMPGTGHGWAPGKKGNEFITGLEDKPEERARLEKLLHVDLSSKSDYYATLTFRLEDKEHGQIMNFDDTAMGPYYEVVYYAMLASDLIANGLHEYKSGKKPFAEWYIENKDAEAEMGQADMTAEIEATNTFPSLSYVKRMDVGKMLGLSVWGVTEKTASKELWDFIKAKPENAIAFNKLTQMEGTEFNVSVLVKTAIKMNIIRRNRTNDYVFASEVLGPTEDHVVSRLMLVTSATLRNAIDRQLKAKL